MRRFRLSWVLSLALAVFSSSVQIPVFSLSLRDSARSQCSPPDEMLREIFAKAVEDKSPTDEQKELIQNLQLIIKFDGIPEPTWKSEAEFSNDLVEEESPLRAAKRMALYHRKHPTSLKFIVTSSFDLMLDRPETRSVMSDALDMFRRFYLDESQKQEFDDIAKSHFRELGTSKQPRVKEIISRAGDRAELLSRIPYKILGLNEDSDRRISIQAIALEAEWLASELNPEKRRKVLQKIEAAINAISQRKDDSVTIKTIARLEKASESLPEDDLARAEEFLNRVGANQVEHPLISDKENTWEVLFSVSRLARHRSWHKQIWDDLFYLRLLKRIRSENQLSDKGKSFIDTEIRETTEVLQKTYTKLEQIDSDETSSRFPRVAEGSAAGHFHTWNWGLTLAMDRDAPRWMDDYLEKFVKAQKSPYELPYDEKGGMATERGAAARSPLVLYALYTRGHGEKRREFRGLFSESLKRNFRKHSGGLLYRLMGESHEGAGSNFKNLDLRGLRVDGMGSHYFYPTLPFMIGGAKEILADTDATAIEKQGAEEFLSEMRVLLLSLVKNEVTGDFLVEANQLRNGIYGQAFAYESLRLLFDDRETER